MRITECEGNHTHRQRTFPDEPLFFLQSDCGQRYGFHCGFPGCPAVGDQCADCGALHEKQNEVAKTLEMLEDIWDEYQVYENDEINYIDDSIKMRYGKVGDAELYE